MLHYTQRRHIILTGSSSKKNWGKDTLYSNAMWPKFFIGFHVKLGWNTLKQNCQHFVTECFDGIIKDSDLNTLLHHLWASRYQHEFIIRTMEITWHCNPTIQCPLVPLEVISSHNFDLCLRSQEAILQFFNMISANHLEVVDVQFGDKSWK
jgi:hypothetical protein